MDLHTTASLYPAISIPDILALPFVKPSSDVTKAIVRAVRGSHAAGKHAHALLERAKRAKRAVEVAIEEGEAAALAYLQDVPGRVGTAHQGAPPPTTRAALSTIHLTEEVPLPPESRESKAPSAVGWAVPTPRLATRLATRPTRSSPAWSLAGPIPVPSFAKH